jgi:hypothetical protein
VKENLETIFPALPHAVGLIRNVAQESLPASHHAHDKNVPLAQYRSTHTHSHSHAHESSRGGQRRTSPWPMIPMDDALQIVLSEAIVKGKNFL